MIQSFRRRKERLPDVQVSSSLYRPSGAVSGLQVAAQTTENADKHSCSPPTPWLKLADADLTAAV